MITNCPFCKEGSREPISEGRFCRVVLSNPRLIKGHLLIIPKRHVERLSELKKEELMELVEKTIEFQGKIVEKISPGCDIRQNLRPFQKQDNLKVNHLHIHLLPRHFKDELYKKSQIFEKDIFNKITEEEEKEMRNILR